MLLLTAYLSRRAYFVQAAYYRFAPLRLLAYLLRRHNNKYLAGTYASIRPLSPQHHPYKNKRQDKCEKDAYHSHCKCLYFFAKKLKNIKKTACINLTDNIYLNSLWKRRWSGKLLSYQVISAENVLTRWGRRDSPGFSRVGKNEKHTAACTNGDLSKRNRCTRWKQGKWTPCTSIAKTVQKN